MQNIIIFTQSTSNAGIYGIGTFINVFKEIYKQKDYNVYLVDLYSQQNEFSVIKERVYTKIIFPNTYNFTKSSFIVDMLNLYINHIEGSICVFNYVLNFMFADIFREKGINVLCIGIIHSFRWTWNLNGNQRKLRQYLSLNDSSESIKQIKDSIKDEKEKIENLDLVVALSKDSGNMLKTIYQINKSKLVVIPNGIKDRYRKLSVEKIKTIKQELYIDQNEKIVLYVGRFDEMKGVDVLVSSFSKVVDSINNSRLVIVGDGDFSIFSPFIGKNASKITFTGRIDSRDIEKWYQIADVGVLPTLSEECSFVGIEMMMHSLPVVSTNGRGVRNMFYNGKNSLTVNCNGGRSKFKNELSDSIIKILSSHTLTNLLRKNSRESYLKNYRFEVMRENYLSLTKTKL